jgi:hypothetical protein
MPVIQLELDSKGAISSLQKFDRAVDKTEANSETAFGKIRTSVNAMGKVAGAALAVATAALVAFGVKAIDAASRMEEAQNKYNVVFRGMTDTVDTWVQELRDNYALSELAAKDYLSSTKAIIDGTNMQSKAAGKLSNKVVLLAQDLASFHDKSPEQAVRAMTSALTGEYEAMKQFGVVLKKTEIIQEAMTQNNLKTKDAVTQAMMAQAAYTLILKKSGEAQGDTIRSQSSYAFQVKQTKALLEDMKVTLGEQLLPIATKWLSALNNWIKKEDGVNKVLNFTIEAVRFVDNGIRGLILLAKGLVVGLSGAFVVVMESIKLLLFPLDLVLKGLKAMGVIDTNPLEAMVQFSHDFFDAQVAGFNATLDGIEKSNQKYDKMKVKIKESIDETNKQTEAQKKVTDAVDGTKTAVDGLAGSVKVVADLHHDFSDKGSVDNLKLINGEWVQLGTSVREVADAVQKEVIPAEENLKTTVDAVTQAAINSVTAINQQAVAAQKIITTTKELSSLAADMGGYDSHIRQSTAPFDATGGALTDDQWQSLEQWQKNSLVKQGTSGSSYDYFNNDTGNRFKGLTSEQREVSQATMASMYFNFNQSMSRSDVTSIIEETTRTAERT